MSFRLCGDVTFLSAFGKLKGKVLPYLLLSVASRSDPSIQAVSLQVTLNHPSSSRLPLLSARPAVTCPAEEHRHLSASTKLYCFVTEAHGCEQIAQGCYSTVQRPGLKLTTAESPV